MLDLYYLSGETRGKLALLEKRLAVLTDPEHKKALREQLRMTNNPDRQGELERQLALVNDHEYVRTLNEQIDMIKRSAKPYTDCTPDELMELKTQLMQRLQPLLRMHRRDRAMPFYNMIQLIDGRMAEMAFMAQRKRVQEIQEESKRALFDDETQKPSDGQIRSKHGRVRWTTGPDRGSQVRSTPLPIRRPGLDPDSN